MGGADRRLGRRRGAVDRDSDQGGNPRQYRRLLAAKDRRCRQRANTPTPIACTGGRTPRSRRAGAVFPNRHRRKGRQQQAVRAGPDRRQTEIGRSRRTVRGVVSAEKAKIKNIVTQPNPATGGWRLSFELRQGQGAGRTARFADAGRRGRYRRSGSIDGHPRRAPRSPHRDPRTLDRFLPPRTPLAMMPSQRWNAAPARRRRRTTRSTMPLRRAFILAGTAVLTAGRLLRDVQVLKVAA